MRRKKRECWTELLRVHKLTRELTRKYNGDEKIRSLQKAMEPPEEFASLTEDVRRAKKEIQETSMARTKARRRTKKALKRSATAAEKSQDIPKRSGRREEALTKKLTTTTRRILTAQKGKKVCRRVVVTDPCDPWEPPSLAKDLQTLFEGLPPASIEKETEPDVAYTEEIEAAHVRVYPRISDFQSNE